MKTPLRAAIEAEWQRARAATALGDFGLAFRSLERAHVLSQRLTFAHVRTHLAMLALGWRRRDAREVLGQATRTLAAALFSRIWVPAGNTGGANVSAFKPMPVPDDLRALLDGSAPPGG